MLNILQSMIKKVVYDTCKFWFKIAHYNFWWEFANSNLLPFWLNEKVKDKRWQLNTNYLLKRFKYFIDDYKDKNIPIWRNDKKIWVLRWQWIDNAPDLVKICVRSIKKYNCWYEVIFLDKDNYEKYVQLPKFILKKVKEKKITITHLSDIIRMYLLKEHWWIWVDSTMYINSNVFKKFDDINFNSNEKWCAFFLWWKSNRLFHFCYDFFIEYHKHFDQLINYFLIDYAIYICYTKFKDCNNDIENGNIHNDEVFLLTKKFNERYNSKERDNLMKIPFFKLTWKLKFREYDKEGNLTNYGKFLEMK